MIFGFLIHNCESVCDRFFRNIIRFMTFWHISHYVFGWCLSHFSFHYQLEKMSFQRVIAADKKMLYLIIWIAVKSSAAAFSKFWNFVEKQFYHHEQNDTRNRIQSLTKESPNNHESVVIYLRSVFNILQHVGTLRIVVLTRI